MKYIINDCVCFDSADGTLCRMDSGDIITLPLPAQRLLLLIITSEGEILKREYLMEAVWDKYGLTGSGSNLNQYLSILRRSVSAFGCEDFIITIPKVGIQLSENVRISELIESYDGTDTAAESTGAYQTPAMRSCRIVFFQVRWLLLIFLSVASLMLTIVLLSSRSSAPSSHMLPLDGGCKLITFSALRDDMAGTVIKNVKIFLHRNQYKCVSGVTLYYDNLASQSLDNRGRALLAYCESDNEGHEIACTNYYSVDGVNSEN